MYKKSFIKEVFNEMTIGIIIGMTLMALVVITSMFIAIISAGQIK